MNLSQYIDIANSGSVNESETHLIAKSAPTTGGLEHVRFEKPDVSAFVAETPELPKDGVPNNPLARRW